MQIISRENILSLIFKFLLQDFVKVVFVHILGKLIFSCLVKKVKNI